jgi:hypothetical protein
MLFGCATERASQQPDRPPTPLQPDVAVSEQADARTRHLIEAVDKNAVRGMTRPDVRSEFGDGIACSLELCRQNGFAATDLYYEVRLRDMPPMKQLPLVLIGFDANEVVVRVFTLTTHVGGRPLNE